MLSSDKYASQTITINIRQKECFKNTQIFILLGATFTLKTNLEFRVFTQKGEKLKQITSVKYIYYFEYQIR